MKLPSVTKLFRKKEEDHYLAVDLGSSVAKAAIFRLATEFEGIKLLGVGTQSLGSSSMRGGRIIDLDAVIETLNLALEEAQLKAGVSANQVILGLSGDAMASKGYRVRTKRSQPDEQMTEEEFEILADQIEERTLDKAQTDLEEKYDCKLERVETNFTLFQMDGAKVRTPLGLTGGELEVAVLHYFLEAEKLSTVNSLAHQLGLDIISLVDTSINLATSLIDDFGDLVLIDIGGDHTQVAVVKDGKLVGDEFIYFGGRDLTEQIKHDFNVTFEDAETMKLSYHQGNLDQERALEIKRSIEKALGWWVEGLCASLMEIQSRELTGGKSLPGLFLLSGQTRHLEEVRSAMASYPWNKRLSLEGFPKVEVLPSRHPGLKALTKIEI